MKNPPKRSVFRPTYFAFPYLVICAIFVILPLCLVFYYAFTEDGTFTIENVKAVFSSGEYLMSIVKTAGIAALTTAICLLIAYPVAMILASAPFNKMAILALLFVIPMWMNFVLRMVALKSLLGLIGIDYGFTAAVIGLVYDFFPFMLLPIYTVLVNMDKSYVEASTDLGANAFTTFRKVTFPLSIPGIVSGITMVFMPVFSAYAVTGMLGDANTGLIGSKIDVLFQFPQTWGIGSALSMVLLLIVFVTMIISNFIMARANKAQAKGDKKQSSGLVGGRIR
jgi:spermidine/putrescine transport system permease protein